MNKYCRATARLLPLALCVAFAGCSKNEPEPGTVLDEARIAGRTARRSRMRTRTSSRTWTAASRSRRKR